MIQILADFHIDRKDRTPSESRELRKKSKMQGEMMRKWSEVNF